MIDDLAWRKFPRNIIENAELQYIADQMEEGLEALPLLLYTVAYCRADDNGIFDLRDGRIFSRLVKLGTVDDLFYCAKLMVEENIFQPVNGPVLLITDWESPNRSGRTPQKPLSADERRAAAAAKIRAQEQKKASAAKFFTLTSTKSEKMSLSQRETERIQRETEERHTHTEFKDRETEGEKTREDEKEDIKETHTQKSGFGFFPEPSPLEDEMSTGYRDEEDTGGRPERSSSVAAIIAEEAADGTDFDKYNFLHNKEIAAELLNNFFAKNCLGYDQDKEAPLINEVSSRIAKLTDDKNPVQIITAVITGQLKKLSEEPGYYKNLPLQPASLMLSGVWSHVMNSASRILRNKENSFSWDRELEMSRLTPQDRAAVDDDLESECLKYGINPEAPDRMMRLALARKADANDNG